MKGSWDIIILDHSGVEKIIIHVNSIREMYDVLKAEYPECAPTSLGLMNKWASARSGPYLKFTYIPCTPLTRTERSRRYYSKLRAMRSELIELRKTLEDNGHP